MGYQSQLQLEAGFVNASLPTELTMLVVVPALINNPLPHMKSMDMALQKLPIHETSRTNWTHLTIFSLPVLLIVDLI